MKLLQNRNNEFLTHQLTFDVDQEKAKVYTAKMDNLINVAAKYYATKYYDVNTKETVNFDFINDNRYVLGIIKNLNKTLNKETKKFLFQKGSGYFALNLKTILENLTGDGSDDYYSIVKIVSDKGFHYAFKYDYYNPETEVDHSYVCDIKGIIKDIGLYQVTDINTEEFRTFLLEYVEWHENEKELLMLNEEQRKTMENNIKRHKVFNVNYPNK